LILQAAWFECSNQFKSVGNSYAFAREGLFTKPMVDLPNSLPYWLWLAAVSALIRATDSRAYFPGGLAEGFPR
jgi:hypothetical protein